MTFADWFPIFAATVTLIATLLMAVGWEKE